MESQPDAVSPNSAATPDGAAGSGGSSGPSSRLPELVLVVSGAGATDGEFYIQPNLSIGRNPSNTVVLEKGWVGPLHAVVRRDGQGGLMLATMEGADPPQVSGVKQTVIPLRSGVEFTLGAATFRVVHASSVSAAQDIQAPPAGRPDRKGSAAAAQRQGTGKPPAKGGWRKRIFTTLAGIFGFGYLFAHLAAWLGPGHSPAASGVRAMHQQHYHRAMVDFRKGAAAGSGKAMYSIGVLYAGGDGVPQDYAKAMEWYRKGAAAGNGDAMYLVGLHYENGQGVPRDYAKARAWFERAEQAGPPWAAAIFQRFCTKKHWLAAEQAGNPEAAAAAENAIKQLPTGN